MADYFAEIQPSILFLECDVMPAPTFNPLLQPLVILLLF